MDTLVDLNPNLQPVNGFDNLPATFNHESVPKSKDDRCNLCDTKFRSVKINVFGTKHHNCTKCGVSVCEKCSLYHIQLSSEDKEKYRVCNRCYFKMQNQPLISFYQGLL